MNNVIPYVENKEVNNIENKRVNLKRKNVFKIHTNKGEERCKYYKYGYKKTKKE